MERKSSAGSSGPFAVSAALLVPASALRAVVLQDLWGWFSDLPALGWWQAWGIILLAFLITPSTGDRGPDRALIERYVRVSRAFVGGSFTTLFVWGLGAAIAIVGGRF